MLGFAACIYFKVNVTLVYDTFIGIITATLLWSVVIAFIVYVVARSQRKGLSPGGNTGTCIKNMYITSPGRSFVCVMVEKNGGKFAERLVRQLTPLSPFPELNETL